MKIVRVASEGILFTNGKMIYSNHEPECCEVNYADLEQLEVSGYEVEFDEDSMVFEKLDDYGFRFGSVNTPMFFIPCYSDQNGYYDSTVDIWYDGRKVLIADSEIHE